MKRPDVKNRHLLTILVEDYFHVGGFEKLIQQRNWSNFEPRYEQNTQKALDLLDEFDTRAHARRPYYLAEDAAIPFDPDHEWREGDVIPGRVLR